VQPLQVERIRHDATRDARDQRTTLGQRDGERGGLGAAQGLDAVVFLHLSGGLANGAREALVVVEILPAQQAGQRAADRGLAGAHHPDQQNPVIGHGWH